MQVLIALIGFGCFLYLGIQNIKAYFNGWIDFHQISTQMRVHFPTPKTKIVARLYLDRSHTYSSDRRIPDQVQLTLADPKTVRSFTTVGYSQGAGPEGAWVSLGTLTGVSAGDYSLQLTAPQEFFSGSYRIALTEKNVFELIAGIFSLVFPGIAVALLLLAKFLRTV